jgi:hypothetical protein
VIAYGEGAAAGEHGFGERSQRWENTPFGTHRDEPESEDAARQMAERVPQTVPEDVELQDVEVRQVVANA